MELISSSGMSVDLCIARYCASLHSQCWHYLKSNIIAMFSVTNMETNLSWKAVSRSAGPRGSSPNRPVFMLRGLIATPYSISW
jgi:hypothetical protein